MSRRITKRIISVVMTMALFMTMTITNPIISKADGDPVKNDKTLVIFRNGTTKAYDPHSEADCNEETSLDYSTVVASIRWFKDASKYTYDSTNDLLIIDNIVATEYEDTINFYNVKGVHIKGTCTFASPGGHVVGIPNGYTTSFKVEMEPGSLFKTTLYLFGMGEIIHDDQLVLGEGVKLTRGGEGDDFLTFTREQQQNPQPGQEDPQGDSQQGGEQQQQDPQQGDQQQQDPQQQGDQQQQQDPQQQSDNQPMGAKDGEKEKAEDGAVYEVTSNTDDTVAYTQLPESTKDAVTIPDEVEIKGKKYKVTKVAEKLCKKNKKIKKVVVGNNVKEIGTEAFYGCENLTSIKLGENVEEIGKRSISKCKNLKSVKVPKATKRIREKAFADNGKLSSITLYAQNLKKIDKKAFDKINKKAKFKLKGTKKQKKAAEKLITKKGTGYKKTMKIKK